jgi:hypothetical protein
MISSFELYEKEQSTLKQAYKISSKSVAMPL